MSKPFVYINISDGIAEEVAYGDVNTLLIDWDAYQDNECYMVEDIDSKIAELERKWPHNDIANYHDADRDHVLSRLHEVRKNILDQEQPA